ncbi:predicted protein [Nematostella vectensis]|uniref:Uncharacterized protein n=1 Tax=Nematostella vectensis TaxID=45351 RepID=A7RGZ1_NEMVE|nr:predicted protein [Nematostella vectensis]|eukprot:XP_001641321.1 predicted protein [Nematostella vectensis]
MQSLAQASRIVASCRLAAARAISGTASSKKATPSQTGFQGLNAGFFWDDKHGFGYGKNGEVILVMPNERLNIKKIMVFELFSVLSGYNFLRILKVDKVYLKKLFLMDNAFSTVPGEANSNVETQSFIEASVETFTENMLASEDREDQKEKLPGSC